MHTLDLTHQPDLQALISMLRGLSRADSSAATLWNFLHEFGRIRKVDFFLGVLPVQSEPGACRVIYFVSTWSPERSWYKRDMTDQAIAKLPIVRGGFITQVMAANDASQPVVQWGFQLQDDPIVPPEAWPCGVCLALPVFAGDRVQEWSLGFSGQGLPQGVSPSIEHRDVLQATLTANLLGIANRHSDSLQEIRRLNAQLNSQLEQIAALQQALLPSRPPEIPGVSIATSYLTSDQSGGDYFDFFPLANGRWGILIADVSGHGAAAATITAMLHAILHGYEPANPSDAINPARVMDYANRRLAAAGLEGNFVTAFFGVLDPITGELAYSNAGHNPPRVWRSRARTIQDLNDSATLPLGIVPTIDAERGTTTLEPGDTLLLYTDGITESFSVGDKPEQYGVERLDLAISACQGSPDAVIETVHRTLFQHRGSATRADDQTIVAVHLRTNRPAISG